MILLDRFATTGSFEHIENIFFWIKQVRYQYYHFGYHLNWLAIEHTGYRKTELLKNYNYVVIDSFQPYYTRHILDPIKPGIFGPFITWVGGYGHLKKKQLFLSWRGS